MSKSNRRKEINKLHTVQENIAKLESDLRQNELQLEGHNQKLGQISTQIETMSDQKKFIELKIEGGFEILTPYYAYEKSSKLVEFLKTQHEKQVKVFAENIEGLEKQKNNALAKIKEREGFIESIKTELFLAKNKSKNP